MSNGLERTIGEVSGKLDHMGPAILGLEKLAGSLAAGQEGLKTEMRLLTERQDRFESETKERLESGSKHFYQTDALVENVRGRTETLEDSAEESKGHRWEAWMVIFAAFASAIAGAIVAMVIAGRSVR